MQTDTRRAWAQTLVGRTVGDRYRLDELLDVGGMGAVFAGQHLEVERPVAIKTLVPGALSDAQAERLRREARRAAAVGGRGVVDVIDFGVDEIAGPFLVMELLAGETLGSRLRRRGALSVREAFEIADAVLATLGRVHARGLVHRDLKPANLFLAREDDDEVVKILDFGIARPARETGETLTRPGAVVGTPRFMAPEQASGARTVDARADVYAMGAILYAMLAGRPPYDDLDAGEALVAVNAGPPRPLRELAPAVDEAVARVVEVAMQTAPDARYADADRMRAALREAVGAPSSPAAEAEVTQSVAPLDRGPVGARPDTVAASPRPLAEATRSVAPLDRGAAARAGARVADAPAAREERPRRRWIVGLALSLGVAGALAWAASSAWTPTAEPEPTGASPEPAPAEPAVPAPTEAAPEAPIVLDSPAAPSAVVPDRDPPRAEPSPEVRAEPAPPRARGADARPAVSKQPAPAEDEATESPGRTGPLSLEDF